MSRAFERLINEIPPHEIYCAAFAGHDAITQQKRRAEQTILIDLDPEPLKWWAQSRGIRPLRTTLFNCDALQWLRYRFNLYGFGTGPHELAARDPESPIDATVDRFFLYVDPPYPMSTRSSGPIYRHEMTDEQHDELLKVLLRLPCMVMLSSYPSEKYHNALRGWRFFEYQAVTRSGDSRKEVCWCNYPTPNELHDSRFVGTDKRHRERIRWRSRRLISTLLALPVLERQVVLDAVSSTPPSE